MQIAKSAGAPGVIAGVLLLAACGGNVWHTGEKVDEYNYDDEDNLIGITHEGAWEAGQDVVGSGVTALARIPDEGDTRAGGRSTTTN